MKFLRTIERKEFTAFNKEGIGGVQVFSKTKKGALQKARDIFGRGASVEFRKKTKIAVFKNR